MEMGITVNPADEAAVKLVAYLRSPLAIRARCRLLFEYAIAGKSRYFDCDLTQIEHVADYVIEVIRSDYPDLQIPFHSRWRHFEVGGIPRLAQLNQQLAGLSAEAKAIAKYDLAIISVLLDAGAGNNWHYHEQNTNLGFKRSEGLAVASFRMFCAGAFSSDKNQPLRVDAEKLQSLTQTELSNGFQVTPENPLIGIDGRLKLLQKLGEVVAASPQLFGDFDKSGKNNLRPGNLVKYLINQASNNQIATATVLEAVLSNFSEIWSGRLKIANVNLGDVWSHSHIQEVEKDGFVPFHKLSQWLTYSLLEPLEELGLEITNLDELTGLPEYRNGGLCLDLGLIRPKHPDIFSQTHSIASEMIVEWRALTVILLDEIAKNIRQKLKMSDTELPLVKILQGGTWTAGRKIAAELRNGGVSPLQIESDGTVF
ncbi:hypothetical protein NIES4101_40630 [Calothrix sp. NIES-4101]|nr:hypothetical protein NIES4101_40630 [Calothrix sp. NIES-4101]